MIDKVNTKFGLKTDIGQRRQINQDSLLAVPEIGLFVVADGMGGHRGGEIASAMAVEAVAENLKRSLNSSSKSAINAPLGELLKSALSDANKKVFLYAQENPELQGMGTTLTALLIAQGKFYIGQVGDSRCYFIKRGESKSQIWQLSRDHSMIQEKLQAGLITRDQLKTDPMRNVITRSIGFEPNVQIDIWELSFPQINDAFLLCSDGLSGPVDDATLLKVIQETAFDAGNPQDAIDKLIALANSNGGDDNITGIIVQLIAN
jgi:serine/threonine protein phosphatase PrpC